MRIFASLLLISLFLASTSSLAMNSLKIMDRRSRIAIIGGGPAGIMAGAQLNKNGYKNITIFERKARLFGKVRTKRIGKTVVETGPIQVGIGHTYTNYWLDKLGLKTFEPHNAFILRPGARANSHRILTSAQEYVPMGERLEIWEEAARFKEILNRFNERYPELKDIPENSEYTHSFADFARDHNLPHFHKMYSIYTSAYGYGITSEIPAFTVLRTFGASYGLVWWLYSGMSLKMIDEGFTGLMQALVDQYDLADKIQYKQNIVKISRSPGEEILIDAGNNKQYFDALIVACPIDKIFDLYQGIVSREEQEMNDNLYYSPYHVLVADVPALPRGGWVLPEKFNQHDTLQMMSKNSVDGDEVVLYVPQISSIKATDIFKRPSMLPGLEQSVKSARRDLAELGFELGTVHDGVAWNQYNPHFLNPTMYRHCDSVQGKMNTFYVGTMCTEIDYVDKALGHATKIVSQYFDGDFDQPEQSASAVANWYLRAENRYSDEQMERSPSQWGLSWQEIWNRE